MSIAFMIRPMETLYLGPPTSFAAGEAHRSVSQFPPSPMTFQGLVRTRLLQGVTPPLDLDDWSRAAQDERTALVGGPNHLPLSWQLEGPFPVACHASGNEEPSYRLWVPTPRFLLLPLQQDAFPVVAQPIPTPHNDPDALSDLSFLPAGAPATSTPEALGGWVSSANLRWAFAGDRAWDITAHKPLPPFVRWESQAGVMIAPQTGTAQHGLLYFLRTMRLQLHSGFASWLAGNFDARIDPSCLTYGVGRAGRGGRPVVFEPLVGNDLDWLYLRSGQHLPTQIPDGTQVWVALVTPARLENPLSPVFPTEATVQVQVRAALVGSSLVLGGYSIVQAEMRENHAYAPPGSAWLVQLRGGTETDRLNTLRRWNGHHVLGPPDESRFGFGQVLVRCPLPSTAYRY